MDREPTPEIVADALKQAQELMREYDAFDLIRALAEATTTQQCRGVQGFKVFAAVREAVSQVLPKGETLPRFSETAKRDRQIDALKSAQLLVMS